MFIINILSYFVEVDVIRYLFIACAFYGTFLCIRSVFK